MTRTAGAGRVVSAAILGGLLLLTLLLALLPGSGAAEGRSAFSTEPEGLRAALLVLRELGWDARPWTRAPGELPREDVVLWLEGPPEIPPGYLGDDEEGTGPIRAVSERRLRDPEHYLRFVEEGGTLIATLSDDMAEFLVGRLGLKEIEELGRPTRAPRLAKPLYLPWGERLEFSLPFLFARLDLHSPFEPFLATPRGRAAIVRLPVGRGELVLLASDDFATNGRLEDEDNALLLVRLFESIGHGGTIYFDEYSLGGWTPDSPLELALAPAARGFTLHLLAVLALGLWSAAWVSSFPRDPEPLALLAPLDRARSWAAWIAAQGRWDVLARLLRLGVLRRLAARSGGAARRLEGRPTPEAEPGASTAALDAADVLDLLRAHRARLGGDEGLRRAAALFSGGDVRGEADLRELAAGLARLEAALGAAETRLRT